MFKFDKLGMIYYSRHAGLIFLMPLAMALMHCQLDWGIMALLSAFFVVVSLIIGGVSALEYLSVSKSLQKFPSSYSILNQVSFSYQLAWKTEIFRTWMFLPFLLLSMALMCWISLPVQIIGSIFWMVSSYRLLLPLKINLDHLDDFFNASVLEQEAAIAKIITISWLTATHKKYKFFFDGMSVSYCLKKIKEQKAFEVAEEIKHLNQATLAVVSSHPIAVRRL